MTACRRYGVRRVLGFRYGYTGIADAAAEPLELTPDVVDDIHHYGGTMLGIVPGPAGPAAMVDRLIELGVDVPVLRRRRRHPARGAGAGRGDRAGARRPSP